MLLVVSLFASLLAGQVSQCVGTVIHVPGDAPTIQAGLDLSADGDTILVAVGEYAEALIAPPRAFTLKGDVIVDTGDYPRPTIDPSSLPGSDSLACLILPLESVPVLEDLTFRNSAEMYPRREYDDHGGIDSWSRDVVMRRCCVDSAYYGFRQMLDVSDAQITLENCHFRHDSVVCIYGVWATWNATDTEFSGRGPLLARGTPYSRFIGCRFQDNDQGYLLQAWGHDVVIRDCVFGPREYFPDAAVLASRFDGVIAGNLFTGLQTYSALAVALEFTSDTVLVQDNTFLNNVGTGNQSGVAMDVWWSIGDGSGRLVTLSDNVVTNCQSNAFCTGLMVFGASADVTENRFFHLEPAGDPALRCEGGQPGDDSVHAHENLFHDVGIAAVGNSRLDARQNWWGDPSGPYHATRNPQGQGEEVQGELLFDPWYSDTSFLSVPGIQQPLPERFVFAAYPNPFNSVLHLTLIPAEVGIIRVEVYDVLGRRATEIWHGPLAFQKEITFDASSLASGIYFARVTDVISRKHLAMAKLVLLK